MSIDTERATASGLFAAGWLVEQLNTVVEAEAAKPERDRMVLTGERAAAMSSPHWLQPLTPAQS